MRPKFWQQLHPTEARLLGEIVELFSECCARMTDHFRPSLWSGDNERERCEILGRPIPYAYLAWISHARLHLPLGWDFYGLTDTGDSSLLERNRALREEELLPDGWLCIGNISDDSYYFFANLTGEPVDMPVLRADPSDLHSLESKAEPVAPSFKAFLLRESYCMAEEMEEFIKGVNSRKEHLMRATK